VVEDREIYLQDNSNAWELLKDGTYKKWNPAVIDSPGEIHDMIWIWKVFGR
jgi:hypothetical protein